MDDAFATRLVKCFERGGGGELRLLGCGVLLNLAAGECDATAGECPHAFVALRFGELASIRFCARHLSVFLR